MSDSSNKLLIIEKQNTSFAVPTDWIDHSTKWVDPLPGNINSTAAIFMEPDESKPYDFRGRINLVLKLSQLSSEQELNTIIDNINSGYKLMKPEMVQFFEKPQIIKIGSIKGVSWKSSFPGRTQENSPENLITTRAVYIPANGYVYKFTLTGQEKQWGKTFEQVIKSIKIKNKIISQTKANDEKAKFELSCKETSVIYYKKPDLAVHSIAFDWPARVARNMESQYKFDASLKMIQYGDSGIYIRKYLNFIEERYQYPGNRYTTGHYGMGTSKAQFVRHPKNDKWFGVDTLEADILIFHDVSDPAQFDKPVRQQPLLKHTITITDRRNGDKLAEMIYWVDILNQRGCGFNLKNAIDEEIFILKATELPIEEKIQSLQRQGFEID